MNGAGPNLKSIDLKRSESRHCVESAQVFWLTESNGLPSVPISGIEGKQVSESPLVEPCEPGLLETGHGGLGGSYADIKEGSLRERRRA